MTEQLTGVFAAISTRDSSDERRSVPGATPEVHHGMTFETPAGTLLVQLDTTGTMPIPTVGETIVLHDQPVNVLSTETAYTRMEPGQPTIYTQVVVDTITPSSPATPGDPHTAKIRKALQAAINLLAYSAGRAAAEDPEHAARLATAADDYAHYLNAE